MLPSQVFVLLKHFIHLLSFFVLQLPERKLHFGFIVSCGFVYHVFKFMNASFQGVVFMHFIHLLLFFVPKLLEYKMHFVFIVSFNKQVNKRVCSAQ